MPLIIIIIIIVVVVVIIKTLIHKLISLTIDRLESQHQYVRAAALATFTVRMMRAIELLIKGAQNKSNETSNSGS